MHCVCSDDLPKDTEVSELPYEAQVSDGTPRASHTVPLNNESTPPPRSDDAADVNGSGKQSNKKTKRTPWYNVRIFRSLWRFLFDSILRPENPATKNV